MVAISFKLYRVSGVFAIAATVVYSIALHLVYYLVRRMGPSAAGINFVIGLPWESCPLLFAVLALAVVGSLLNRLVPWVLASVLAALHLFLSHLPRALSAMAASAGVPFLLGLSVFFFAASTAVFVCSAGCAFALALHGQKNRGDEFYGGDGLPPVQGKPFRLGCGAVFLALVSLPILVSTVYLSVAEYHTFHASLDTSGWEYDAWEYARYPAVRDTAFPDFSQETPASDPEEEDHMPPWARIEGYRAHIAPAPVGVFAEFRYIPHLTAEELRRMYQEHSQGGQELIALTEGVDSAGRPYTEMVFLSREDTAALPLQYVERWYSIDGDIHVVGVAFLTSQKRGMLTGAGQAYLDRVILAPQGGADTEGEAAFSASIRP